MKEPQPHEPGLRLIDTGASAPLDERLIDQDASLRLRDDVGEVTFTDMLEDAIFEITERLAPFEAAMKFDALEDAAEIARGLTVVARSIGFTAVATVAEIAAGCCQQKDDIAARAVASRLMRVGEDSLNRAAMNGSFPRR